MISQLSPLETEGADHRLRQGSGWNGGRNIDEVFNMATGSNKTGDAMLYSEDSLAFWTLENSFSNMWSSYPAVGPLRSIEMDSCFTSGNVVGLTGFNMGYRSFSKPTFCSVAYKVLYRL